MANHIECYHVVDFHSYTEPQWYRADSLMCLSDQCFVYVYIILTENVLNWYKECHMF